jgi:hypothetical protein
MAPLQEFQQVEIAEGTEYALTQTPVPSLSPLTSVEMMRNATLVKTFTGLVKPKLRLTLIIYFTQGTDAVETKSLGLACLAQRSEAEEIDVKAFLHTQDANGPATVTSEIIAMKMEFASL